MANSRRSGPAPLGEYLAKAEDEVRIKITKLAAVAPPVEIAECPDRH